MKPRVGKSIQNIVVLYMGHIEQANEQMNEWNTSKTLYHRGRAQVFCHLFQLI